MNVPSWLPTLVFVPLVGFALYRRFRRTFGRQPVSAWRMVLRIVLLGVLCTLLLATGANANANALAAAGGGAFVGIVLAVVGLRLTTYENTPQGGYYTPNRWIGLAVTALFLGRLVARIFTAQADAAARLPPGSSPLGALQRSPLTLAVFFVMAGYYAVFYVGVLWKSRHAAGESTPVVQPK